MSHATLLSSARLSSARRRLSLRRTSSRLALLVAFACLTAAFFAVPAAQAQTVTAYQQDFEGNENWPFFSQPRGYDNGPDDVFQVSSGTENISAVSGGRFFAVEGTFPAFRDDVGRLAFTRVDVSGLTDVEISFQYNVEAWNDVDNEINYELIAAGAANAEGLVVTAETNGWQTQTISVPDEATSVRLNLFVRQGQGNQQNDENDVGLDNFRLTGTPVDGPAGAAVAASAAGDASSPGDAGWRMLAPPVTGVTVGGLADSNLVQGVPGVYGGKYDDAPANLYTGGSGGTIYEVPSGPREPIQRGRGFIWYFYEQARVPETNPLPDTLYADTAEDDTPSFLLQEESFEAGAPPPSGPGINQGDQYSAFPSASGGFSLRQNSYFQRTRRDGYGHGEALSYTPNLLAATPDDQLSPGPRYGNTDGLFFAARQGTRQVNGSPVSETSVVFDEITDLQGATEITFTGFFAANQTFTGQGESGYEDDEGITVEYRVDGGAYTPLLQFRKSGTGNRALGRDTDFDDNGDAGNLFQYFGQHSATTALPAGAGSVQFRVRFDVDEPVEYVAFDNMSVSGRDRSQQVAGLGAGQTCYLMGNPYPGNYDLEGLNLTAQNYMATVQIWDPNAGGEDANGNTGTFVPVTQGDNNDIISVWQGFLAQPNEAAGPVGEQLTFDPSGRTSQPAPFYGGANLAAPSPSAQRLLAAATSAKEGARRVLPLRLSGKRGDTLASYDSAIRLYFHPDAKRPLAPDAAADLWDAVKLAPPSGSGPFGVLAFTGSEGQLKAQEGLPATLGEGERFVAPLQLFVSDSNPAEHFTVSWPRDTWQNIPENWTVTLRDTLTGDVVDLRASEQYTFDALGADAAVSSEAVVSAASISRTDAAAPTATALHDLIASGPRQASRRTGVASSVSSIEAPSARFVLTVGRSSVIPVEAEGFEARVEERSARFSWRTLSETNSDRFVIERQSDTGSWTEAAAVASKAEDGYSSEPIQYETRVEDLPYGTHVFRLRQVDHDDSGALVGEETRVEVTLQEAYSLSAVYPNPLRDRGTVEVTAREEQEVTVELFDATGRRVRTLFEGTLPASRTRRLTIRPGSLASGVYIVRLQGDEGTRTQTVTLVR